MKTEEFLRIMDTAEKLKNHTRHSWTSSGRHESVAEHSWRLALMAYFVRDEYPDLDMGRVILMCLFHDMGEAFTGDIPAFEKTGEHERAEAEAVEDWLSGLPSFYREELGALFSEMEERQTPEARLYKALDKLEALIQHNEADISTWLPLEHELQMTYGVLEAGWSRYTRRLRERVRKDSQEKLKRDDGGEEALNGKTDFFGK